MSRMHTVNITDDQDVLEALRHGDEDTFVALLERYHGTMVRLARTYVSDNAVAEDVAQDAWQGVLQGLERFEARCSVKTWIFRILTNCAKTRAQREGRSMPFSSMREDLLAEPAVAPDRFRATDPWRDHWTSFPRSWDHLPEDTLLANEIQACIRDAIEALPPAQRQVIWLRDVEGWTAEEVCDALVISEANQRVLLHRARSKVRRALEIYLDERIPV